MSEQPKKLTGRGGPGRGQGRKPLSSDEPTVEITISLPESYWVRLRELGEGNVSAGVREAMRRLTEYDGRTHAK